jgi:hypothetical protein
MPVLTDFYLVQREDGIITISMQPPVPLTNRSIRWQMTNRFDGISGLIQKYGYSGYQAGQSGITVNTPNTSFNVSINSADTSGLDAKNFAWTAELLDTPRTCVAEGYALIGPGGMP